ncbi:cationic amino acid transporter 2-like [Oppia nitens]|uniref:cationic amino acid transporter 2-like n=1 Tax=Oppia nitens TaxID=1686743 RepID=UPI0023DAD4DD|nr:cationic amino acid transporter 2-like [Oppia nitens]
MILKSILRALIRRKQIATDKMEVTELARVLSMFDLICLGVGSTLGTGVYVLAGDVASSKSGPAVIIAFVIAAISSMFAGLCYAEFGSRVPRAGSAYLYSYVTVGEFMAFVIGWNLILENVIGTASVARAYSVYLDALFDGKMSSYMLEKVPMHVSELGQYPDPLSFILTLILTVLLAIGVKESIRFHTYMTCVNLLVVVFMVVCGIIKADTHNWAIDKSEIPDKYADYRGNGGFFPFGFRGVMEGAATCFYAFIGFDAIATTGEEARNAKRAIPISIVTSLALVFVAYFSVSAVQTLMFPYYMQSKQFTKGATFPYIFQQLNWQWAKWLVSIGALSGLSTSLLGAMYPLPRVLYSMASDGVLFRFLATVHRRFQTPLYATLIAGLLTAIMAALFDIDQLVDMNSIGTLMAYTLVAESILIIRYADDLDFINDADNINDIIDDHFANIDGQQVVTTTATASRIARQLINLDGITRPTCFTSRVSNTLIATITLLIIVLDIELYEMLDYLYDGNVGAIVGVCLTMLLILVVGYCLTRQPTIAKSKNFEVPWIPLVPFLSVFVNVYLMLNLSKATWIRFAVWMFIGLLIYTLYGIRHSSLRNTNNNNNKIVEKISAKDS